VQNFEYPNITVGELNDAKGSTVRSSHVSGNGRMTLASLVNIQKTSRRQKAQGYDAPSKMGASCQKLRKVKIKSSKGTSHQPYGKCHVDGAGETLSFPPRQVSRPHASTRVKVNVKAKAKVNRLTAPGTAKTLKALPV